jgi:chromosome partitioning protein
MEITVAGGPEAKKGRRRIITVCSPKGGVGKTTLTTMLLVGAGQAGLSAVGLDFDQQQSLTKWSIYRRETRKALPSEKITEVVSYPCGLSEWREALERFGESDLIVIDTPPGVEANLPAIRGLCEAADIVLVPTGAGRYDLDSVLPWMRELVEGGIKASFVLNKINRRFTSFQRSRTKLLKVGSLCPVELPQLEEISTQVDNGLTCLDMAASRGREAMDGIWAFAQREAHLA